MTPTLLMILIPVAVGLSFLLIMAFHAPREAPRLEAPGISPPGEAASRSGTQRLLVAVDGSPSSAATIAKVAGRPWPAGSEIEVVTVIHSVVPVFPDPAFSMAAVHAEQERQQVHDAPALLEAAVGRLQSASPGVTVSSKVLEGDPAEEIIGEAQRLNADEIFLGSHGHGPLWRGVMGSVAEKIVAHAPCSVQIVRAA
jgi:nucleotide-binding universal stress UspA family protein